MKISRILALSYLHALAVLTIFAPNLGSAQGNTDFVYELVELPEEWDGTQGNPKVNDKGQVFWIDHSNSQLQVEYYLPHGDYGLSAGIHQFSLPSNLSYATIRGVTDTGELYGTYGQTGDSLGEFFGWATHERSFVDLGLLFWPLAMTDTGLLFGSRNDNEGLEGDLTQLLSFNVATQTEQASAEAVSQTTPPGVYPYVQVYFGNTLANESGTFYFQREDYPAIKIAEEIEGKTIFRANFFSANTLQSTSIGGSSRTLSGSPDGLAELPTSFSFDNGDWMPSWGVGTKKNLVSVNSHGQVLGTTRECDVDCIVAQYNESKGEVIAFIWLPEAAYGFSAGYHLMDELDDLATSPSRMPSKITANGDLLFPALNQIWSRGHVITPQNHLSGSEVVVATKGLDINNRGDYLVRGTVDGGSEKLLLLRNAARIRASVTLSDPFPMIDEPFEAEVEVRYTDEDPITVSFTDRVLTTLDEEFLEITVEEADPFVLSAADPVRVFTAQVMALKLGDGELSSTIEAVIDGELTTVTASEQVVSPPLEVILRALPLIEEEPIVNMELVEVDEELVEVDEELVVTDDEGNEIEPKIEVTVRNLSDVQVDVLLQGLDPKARDKSEVVGRIETVGEFPIDLGTLAAGAEVTQEIPLQIYNNGRFEFSALATGVFIDSGAQFSKTFAGAPIAVGVPYPVELELDFVRTPQITNQNNGAYFLEPGGELRIIGAVNNISTNSTLHFYGVRAEKHLNAMGANLTSEEGNLADPPFVHDHEVDANSSVVLSGVIRTSVDGGPSGRVTWTGLEEIKLVDDATEEEIELTMDDVLVKSEVGGWLGEELTLRVIQDNSLDAPADLTGLEQTAVFSHGAMIGIGEWTYDTFDAIGGLGRLAGTISADPSLLADAWGEASRAVWETAELLANTWENMSAAEREEFIQSAAGEVQRRLLLYTVIRSPIDAEDSAAVLNWTREATYSLFGGVSDAYATDDPAVISEMLGRVSGHVGMEVVTSLIPAPNFTRYAKGAELSKLATNKSLGSALTDQEALLRAIKSGPLDHLTARKAFGVGKEDIDRYQEIFTLFRVKGYARERAPESYRLINLLKEAIWKPENMKPKGISDLDLLLLGEPLPNLPGLEDPTRVLELKAITGVFHPGSDAVIRTRLKAGGQSDEVIEAALSRAADRREEYQKYASKFREWKDDGFSVALNYKDNGVPDPVDQKDVIRAFDYDELDLGTNRPTLYIPKLANEAGDLRYISGDIDWVHFSFLDGSPLDPDTARKLYDALTRAGLQHPETISWLRDGQTIFKAKANQIVDYVRGHKALFELSEMGPRAVRISEELTRFARNGRDHLIFFENGIKSRKRARKADIESAVALVQKLYPRPVLLPFLWSSKAQKLGDDTTLEGNEWIFKSSDGSELLLRQNEAGDTERYDGSRWVFWSAPPAPASTLARSSASASGDSKSASSAEEPLGLTPTTSLASASSAGDSTLDLIDLVSLWPDELSGRVENWFEAGQKIVIAPGELSQEVRFASSVDPLVLSAPLSHDHPAGTLVAVVPVNLVITGVSDTASELISTVVSGDEVTMTWASLAGRTYTLEVASGESPLNWSPLVEEIVSERVIVQVTLPLAEFDESASYRLRDAGEAPKWFINSILPDIGSATITLEWPEDPGIVDMVEVSESLEFADWGAVLPETTQADGQLRAVLPFDPDQIPKRFYRIRPASASAAADGSEILEMSYDTARSEMIFVWDAETGVDYQLEFAEHLEPQFWATVGSPVTATGSKIILRIALDSAERNRIYRVRELEP